MVLRPVLRTSQRQRLGLTQEIKQSLQYLALAGLRLEQNLNAQIETNPFLTATATHGSHGDPDWLDQLVAPGPAGLSSYLRAEAETLFWHPTDRAIANFLIDHLAPSGLLERPLADLELPGGASLSSFIRVRDVLNAQEPYGLFSDDLGACFAAQLRAQDQLGATEALICGNLNLFAEKPLEAAASDLNLPTSDATAVLLKLRELSPRPADALDVETAVPFPPDLIIEPAGPDWAVSLNPLVHRNFDLDSEALAGLSEKAKAQENIAQQIQSAKSAVKAVRARGQTLLTLARLLASEQSDALRFGRQAIRPLTQSTVAQALSLHSSTVSRAVMGKSVQTPQGVWTLKSFFSALIDEETQLSAAGLRHQLLADLSNEDRMRPLSDSALLSLTRARGHSLARRTITKYRLALGLPSAAHRAQAYARQTAMSANQT